MWQSQCRHATSFDIFTYIHIYIFSTILNVKINSIYFNLTSSNSLHMHIVWCLQITKISETQRGGNSVIDIETPDYLFIEIV